MGRSGNNKGHSVAEEQRPMEKIPVRKNPQLVQLIIQRKTAKSRLSGVSGFRRAAAEVARIIKDQ